MFETMKSYVDAAKASLIGDSKTKQQAKNDSPEEKKHRQVDSQCHDNKTGNKRQRVTRASEKQKKSGDIEDGAQEGLDNSDRPDRKAILSEADIESLNPAVQAKQPGGFFASADDDPQELLSRNKKILDSKIGELNKAKNEITKLKTDITRLESQNKKKQSELNKAKDNLKDSKRECQDWVKVWEESQKEVTHLQRVRSENEQTIRHYLEQRNRDVVIQQQEVKNLEGQIEQAKSKEAELASTIEKLGTTIAYTHSKSEFHPEKDDAYFHDGFGKLESSIQNWVFQNFRGVKEVPEVVLAKCPNAFIGFDTAERTPKEVQLRVRHFIISVIKGAILQNHHCGMSNELSGALELVLSYLPKGRERTRSRASMLHKFLKSEDYQENIRNVVVTTVNNLEELLGSHTSSVFSKQVSRKRTMTKIVEQAVELSTESSLLSSSSIGVDWFPPEKPNNYFVSEYMSCADISTDAEADGLVVQGIIFPMVWKETFAEAEAGSSAPDIIRKQTVHLGPPVDPGPGSSQSSDTIVGEDNVTTEGPTHPPSDAHILQVDSSDFTKEKSLSKPPEIVVSPPPLSPIDADNGLRSPVSPLVDVGYPSDHEGGVQLEQPIQPQLLHPPKSNNYGLEELANTDWVDLGYLPVSCSMSMSIVREMDKSARNKLGTGAWNTTDVQSVPEAEKMWIDDKLFDEPTGENTAMKNPWDSPGVAGTWAGTQVQQVDPRLDAEGDDQMTY